MNTLGIKVKDRQKRFYILLVLILKGRSMETRTALQVY